MKRIFFCLLFFCLNQAAFAQKEGNTWVFSGTIVLHFNEDTIAATDTFSNYNGLFFFNTSYTGNDTAGNLQFYTNGAYIYNRLGQIMDGCDTFVSPSAYIYGIANSGVGAGAPQGVVGFRKPGSDHLYYLFHNISSDCDSPNYRACYLYYSVIDMSQNAGLGKVVDLNHLLFTDNVNYFSYGSLMACRHANGKDWWLVQGKLMNLRENIFFLVDEAGIHEPALQTIGDSVYTPNPLGQIVFSPDGTLMAKAYGAGTTNLFDFNRCDGTLSDPRYIATIDTARTGDSISNSCSVAFSPNGRFIYVCMLFKIFQYDLWAEDIQGSETQVWDIGTPNTDYTLFFMQLAPDGRIYIGPHSSSSDRKYLTVINKPNEKGAACDFRYGGVPFPFMEHHGYGIPNMPDYSLQASPIYQAFAAADQTICKDSLTQVGGANKIDQLLYTWSSSDPLAYISDVHAHNPQVSTCLGEAEFYLQVTDTASTLTCLEKTDTVKVSTYSCNPGPVKVPTIINAKSNPYLVIANLPAATTLRVFNAAGQLIYKSADYHNEWNASSVASGIYVIETIGTGNFIYRGKLLVIN